MTALALAAVGQNSGDDVRKDKILANLKNKFPQLQKATLVMGEIKPSKYCSLDESSFTMNGRQQKFLLSDDDTEFYMISDPIDVSLGAEELNVAQAKREAEEAAKAAERQVELAALAKDVPFKGNPGAPVTIIEFSDFQCPYCLRAANTVAQILEKYPNDVKFVLQHFPLNFHPWAKPAAIASECAANQDDGAFWALHDSYFKNQKALNPGNVIAKSKEYLAGSEIDLAKWSDCAENKESDDYKAASTAVDVAIAAGKRHGVSGTPDFFVNGHFLNGAQPLPAFEPLIEAIKNGKPVRASRGAASDKTKRVGDLVRWTEYKKIESDDCVSIPLVGRTCHTVKYKFEFRGKVANVDREAQEYDVFLTSVKIIPQERVSAMYWTYKNRAQAWGERQQRRTIEFKHVN